MDRDTAVSLIKARLTRSGTTELDETIISEMRFAQETACEGAPYLPWFLLVEVYPVNVTGGVADVELPNGFLRESDDGGIWLVGEELTPLVKDDLGYLVGEYPGSGTPTHYAMIDESVLRLFPTPDKDYELKCAWYMRDAPLTTNIENKWLRYASDVLIAETGLVVARDVLRDMSAAETFQMLGVRAWERLKKMSEARLHAGRSYVSGF